MALPSNGQLPSRPSLEQSRNQARDLLRGFRAGDAAALSRVRQQHPRLSGATDEALRRERFTLSDAQLVIAREAGFPNWARLRRQVERITGPDRCRPFVRELSYYDDRAQGLRASTRRASGAPWRSCGATTRGSPTPPTPRSAPRASPSPTPAWCSPRSMGSSRGRPSRARLTRSPGAKRSSRSWRPSRRSGPGDLLRLDALLTAHPELVNARGTNGNRLLHLATSMRKVDLAKLLLARGADPNAANNKGWTPLHQAAYGNPVCDGGANLQLLEPLLAAGAAVDRPAHGDGGTPLVQALFWGNRPQAEILAERGITPLNLRVAAALGRPDLVRSCFTRDGRLKPQAGSHREFHRPHSGFPAWRPSDDPQEILDEALVWAAKNDRPEVMDFLRERGADPDADPYRGTPLLWAAANGHRRAAAWLLDHGADVNRRATFGGPSHGQGVTALHLAAQNGNLEMVRFLLERGADPSIEDENYHSTPAGWANHFGHQQVHEILSSPRA